MKLKSHSPLLDGWEGEAELSTEHPASSYGQPVLLVDGEPVGTLEAAVGQYEVLEASEEERKALEAAGYSFKGRESLKAQGVWRGLPLGPWKFSLDGVTKNDQRR